MREMRADAQKGLDVADESGVAFRLFASGPPSEPSAGLDNHALADECLSTLGRR
jgi:hypothetical protein